jgi:hypothetical protein
LRRGELFERVEGRDEIRKNGGQHPEQDDAQPDHPDRAVIEPAIKAQPVLEDEAAAHDDGHAEPDHPEAADHAGPNFKKSKGFHGAPTLL